MIYKISFLAQAEEDLAWFRKHSKKDYIRRVNRKDRMVYTIYEKEKEIDISSFRGHNE